MYCVQRYKIWHLGDEVMYKKVLKSKLKYFLVFIILIISVTNIYSQVKENQNWESFVRERIGGSPEKCSIICIGSSHMEYWKTVKNDLDSLTIHNFGIGGTTMEDATNIFAENIVIPYKPRAVILYEGSNDIAYGRTPTEILIQFVEFYTKIHQVLPCTRIYVLGLVPSPGKRFEKWNLLQETNYLIRKACSLNKLLVFIDTSSGLINEEGTPRMECFIPGDIHMTKQGYKEWEKAVAPVVVKREKLLE